MRRILLPAAGVLALTGVAEAVTATATFGVQMSIQAACTITEQQALHFGSAGGLTTSTDQTATFKVQCSPLTPYDISLNAGVNGGTIAERLMRNQLGATIGYQLYQDAARTILWGDGENQTVSGTGSGSAQLYTIYGRVPSQGTPAPGNYSDTVTITVTY